MKRDKQFNNLIEGSDEAYIGHGNPNASILFQAQESARDDSDNHAKWEECIKTGIRFDDIDPTKIEKGLPVRTWANQKFQVRSKVGGADKFRGEEGTARTWFNYQKLINLILHKTMSKDDYLDFQKYTFSSDMNGVASEKHKVTAAAKESVKKRADFFRHPFFQSFPIIIAGVGHFPRDTYGDSYFHDVFGVDFVGETIHVGKNQWININESDDKLLIHCPQLSGSVSDDFLQKIADIVIEFANRHNVNLLPEE